MNKSLKAQSTLELIAIITFVTVSIFFIGPTVIRSVNAHFKLWDDSVQDSYSDPMVKAPIPTNPINCSCDPWQGDAPAQCHVSPCGVFEKIQQKFCNPPNCQYPSQRCVEDAGCCDIEVDTAICCLGNSAAPPANCPVGERVTHRACGLGTTQWGSRPDDTDTDGNPSCKPLCLGQFQSVPYLNSDDLANYNPKLGVICPGDDTNLQPIMRGSPPAPSWDVNALGFGIFITYVAARHNTCDTISTTGAHTWVAPPDVSPTATLMIWGAGGAGGTGGSGTRDGGGGGGGGAISTTINVSPQTTYYLNIGAGGTGRANVSNQGAAGNPGGTTWFSSSVLGNNPNLYISAAGGGGGTSSYLNATNNGGAGGNTFSSIGGSATTTLAGGDGGSAVASTTAGCGGGGGGGGGAAGTTAAAVPASCSAATAGAGAALGGGKGGNGNTTNGTAGTTPGGGSAGSRTTATTRVGGNGKAVICYDTGDCYDPTKCQLYCPDPLFLNPSTNSECVAGWKQYATAQSQKGCSPYPTGCTCVATGTGEPYITTINCSFNYCTACSAPGCTPLKVNHFLSSGNGCGTTGIPSRSCTLTTW